jgi:hypothetical protein
MADISQYSIVTYERRPGHWRAAITPIRRSEHRLSRQNDNQHRDAGCVNKRPRMTPPPLGRSIAQLADRRRDPTPINTLSCGVTSHPSMNTHASTFPIRSRIDLSDS